MPFAFYGEQNLENMDRGDLAMKKLSTATRADTKKSAKYSIRGEE